MKTAGFGDLLVSFERRETEAESVEFSAGNLLIPDSSGGGQWSDTDDPSSAST